LLDRFGNHKGLVVCCTLVCIGSVLVALAPSLPDMCFILMIAGRFIFGLGAETSYVAQNKVLVTWFRDKEMALAMSLSVSAGRLGTWFTFSIIPIAIRNFGGWHASLYIAALVAFFELFSIFVYITLERIAEKKIGRKMDKNAEDPPMNLKDVMYFPGSFWYFAFVVCFFYAAMFPFTSTLTSLLQFRYGYIEADAAHITSMLPLIALILTPIFGLVVSRIGHRITLTIVGLIIMIGSNAIMFSTTWLPLPYIFGVGVGFALVPAAVWPCLPLIVEEKHIGTAFGLVQSLDNAGMLLSYYSQGLVKYMFEDNAAYALMFFTALLVVSLIASIVWFAHDQKKGAICKQVYSNLKELTVN